ncbi:hypothetical protein BKA70DRAFT_1219292 [Coprinopsis sp. MPI-PUGE-AT-0042]|nr:hypothetical protein BKA70DRAFT_1219292 [Coprinopsis sp. MPI-PUGE-AT-0042]
MSRMENMSEKVKSPMSIGKYHETSSQEYQIDIWEFVRQRSNKPNTVMHSGGLQERIDVAAGQKQFKRIPSGRQKMSSGAELDGRVYAGEVILITFQTEMGIGTPSTLDVAKPRCCPELQQESTCRSCREKESVAVDRALRRMEARGYLDGRGSFLTGYSNSRISIRESLHRSVASVDGMYSGLYGGSAMVTGSEGDWHLGE